MLKILPYKMGSASAKEIARALRIKRIRPDGDYRPGRRCVVLNWGNSSPAFSTINWINHPSAVAVAANKLSSLQVLEQSGVNIPAFTTRKEVAQGWLNNNYRVVVRHLLNGHSGQGIVILFQGDSIPDAPLYTRYTKKEKEYRVHVFGGKVIDVAQKRKRKEENEGFNKYVRNHATGWVFCRENIGPPATVLEQSIKAVDAIGLDFGAVDIGYSPEINRATVFEVNSAPGLQGSTLEAYKKALREYL